MMLAKPASRYFTIQRAIEQLPHFSSPFNRGLSIVGLTSLQRAPNAASRGLTFVEASIF
jgi:hypothetical protein